MIRHVIEVWLLLLGAFIVGGILGTFTYVLIAESPFAERQQAIAASVGRGMDRVRRALGLTPTWGSNTFARSDAGYYERDFVSYDATVKPHDHADDSHGDLPGEVQVADQPVAAPAVEGAVAADPGVEEVVTPADDAAWDDDTEWDVAGPPVPETVSEDIEEVSTEGTDEEADQTAMRPAGLAFPRNGVPDDLQRIRGIGKKNEAVLNGFGIYHFGQIAAWTPAEVRWMAQHLSFPERIERDDWIGQATILATGGDTGYVKAEARRAPSSVDEAFGDAPGER